MNNDIISHIKQIQEASRQNRLVVFVGSGVSASAGVPLWNELISEMKKELPIDIIKDETDFLKIAQLYKDQRGEKEYLERVKDILQIDKVAPTPIHDVLIKLNPCHIITTNYDNLLEQAALHNNENYHVVRRDEDIPYNHGERMIIKMHGDFDSRKIVLTENDYYDYQLNYPLIRAFILSLFASKLILFVGFSFNDTNIKNILRWVEQALHGHMQRVYWLADRELTNLEAIYYTNKNIQTTFIDNADLKASKKTFDNKHSEDLYRRLNLLSNDYRENTKSVISLALDYFPKYTDQIVVFGNSLRNFLPYRQRTNLRVSDLGEVTLPDYYSKVFIEQIKGINISKNKYENFTVDQIRYLLSLLRLNAIYKVESLDLRDLHIDRAKEENNPINDFYICDYITLEKSLKHLKIQPLTYTRNDMVLPFILYKAGKYEEAYLKYTELAKEMLIHKRYILYYICMCNLRAVLWTLLNHSSKLISLDEILDKLNGINIEEILNSLPIEEDIKKTLRENTAISTHSNYIKSIDLKEKLAHQRKQSEYGGMAYNSNVSVLMYEFRRLFNKGIENYIIQDTDTYCRKFYHNATEGVIDSLLTIDDDSHSQSKLQELYQACIYLLIFGISNKDLCNIFNEHEAREIKANQDFKNSLQRICENLTKYIKHPNHYNDIVRKEVTADFIKNIILLCNFLDTPPHLNGIYDLIEYYWDEGRLYDWTGYLRYFIDCQRPTEEEAMKIMKKLISAEPWLDHSDSFPHYVAEIAQIASSSKKKLTISNNDLKDKNATILASLLLVVNNNDKKLIIDKILDKKDLCEIIEAEYNTRAHFLSAEMIKSYEIVIPKNQDQWVEEYTCSKLYELSQDDQYSFLHEAISVFRQKHPCYIFYENPLVFKDIDTIKATWLFYCSDKDIKELLRNDNIMKIVKEYCSSHKWRESFKRRIWNLL